MKLLSLRALTNRGEAGGGGGVQADSGRPVGLSAPPAASNAPTGSFLVNAPFPSLQLRRQKSANARAAVRAATVHGASSPPPLVTLLLRAALTTRRVPSSKTTRSRSTAPSLTPP